MSELRMTSEKCLVIMLQLSTSLIIWMQNFFSPSENFGLKTTKKQSPYLSSQVVPSAKAGMRPEVRLILPSSCPVPSLKRNMLELFSRRKFSRRPTMESVQKDCPSKVESSSRWLLIWQRVSGMIALSFTGLQSFFCEQAIWRLFRIILECGGKGRQRFIGSKGDYFYKWSRKKGRREGERGQGLMTREGPQFSRKKFSSNPAKLFHLSCGSYQLFKAILSNEKRVPSVAEQSAALLLRPRPARGERAHRRAAALPAAARPGGRVGSPPPGDLQDHAGQEPGPNRDLPALRDGPLLPLPLRPHPRAHRRPQRAVQTLAETAGRPRGAGPRLTGGGAARGEGGRPRGRRGRDRARPHPHRRREGAHRAALARPRGERGAREGAGRLPLRRAQGTHHQERRTHRLPQGNRQTEIPASAQELQTGLIVPALLPYNRLDYPCCFLMRLL